MEGSYCVPVSKKGARTKEIKERRTKGEGIANRKEREGKVKEGIVQ